MGGGKGAQLRHCGNQEQFTRKSDVCVCLKAAAGICLASSSEECGIPSDLRMISTLSDSLSLPSLPSHAIALSVMN